MKPTKRPVILVAFLLVLYIVPSIFISSYAAPTIPTQPNMTKEFANAEYLDESPYSITGFDETLPDDELFFPDGVTFDPVLAYDGGGTAENNDWYDTFEVDGSSWSTFEGDAEYIQFQAEFGNIEYYDYAFFARAIGGVGPANLTNHDGGFLLSIAQNANYTWYNGSYTGESWTPFQVAFLTEQIIFGDAIQFDYMEVTFHVMTLADSEHYAESFSDVSDWASYSFSGGDSFSSTGDVCNIYCEWGGGTDYDGITTNVPSISAGSYFEFYYWLGASAGGFSYLSLYSQDNRAGNSQNVSCATIGSWATIKGICLYDVESVLIWKEHTSTSLYFVFDYLRISPATESGWQHDGSTTEGVTVENGAGMSSDGDLLTITSDASSQCRFYSDTTTTSAYIDPDYYPFIHIRFNSLSIGKDFALESYDGSYRSLQAQTTISKTDYYYNVRAVSGTDWRYLRFYFYDFDTIVFDLIKAYSIANYIITQGNCETDDVVYVIGSELYMDVDQATTGEYIRCLYDPVVSIDALTYNWFSITTNMADEGFYFTWYNPAANVETTINGTLSGTVTSFYIQADSKDGVVGIRTVSAIAFIDMHHWRLIDSETIYFDLPRWHTISSVVVIIWMELSQIGIDISLIFLGLFLIPASTIYMAKGGLKEASMTKVFFALVAFILGWAFFVGGIM